nr:hypothetical protein CFP56_32217 [Quercus suber]
MVEDDAEESMMCRSAGGRRAHLNTVTCANLVRTNSKEENKAADGVRRCWKGGRMRDNAKPPAPHVSNRVGC